LAKPKADVWKFRTSLVLLVAVSAPEQKEIIRLIMNMLVDEMNEELIA